MAPRGNGSGPAGGGAGSGRGRGSGGRRGRMGGNAAGPGGVCYCPACKKAVPHKRGAPCAQQVCPFCGVKLVRE